MIHPNAPRTAAEFYGPRSFLMTVADSMGLHSCFARLDAVEHNRRAAMTPQQLRDYRVHLGELAEQCPGCDATYVEVHSEEFPDMVGTTTNDTYACCGHTDVFNDSLVYRGGVAVDVR